MASTHGGEWQGPCPACGGTDRFHVWPLQNGEKGGYWCRSCGKAGDNIQFLIDFEGLNFAEACRQLNIAPAARQEMATPREESTRPREFAPAHPQSPAELWQEKAGRFLTWAREALAGQKDVLDWLAARGIGADAVKEAALGWNNGEGGKDLYRARTAWGLPKQIKENGKQRMLWLPRGLVIPYVCHCETSPASRGNLISRLRIRRPEGEPRYYVVPGSAAGTMIIHPERRAFVLVESELDAIACAAAQEWAGAVALGTLEGKPDAAAHEILRGAAQILNALDYGDSEGGAKAAKRALAWWQEHYPQCERWPVPRGKDPGEAYALGIDLKNWIKAGLAPGLTVGVKREALSVKREDQNSVIPAGAGIQLPTRAAAPPLLAELRKLLKDNPGVKIINTPGRFTVLRHDRFVGGRINHLVFREKEVTDYLLAHPDEEITWENLFKSREA